MNEELLQKNIEIRSLSEQLSNGTIKADEARTKLEELRAEKRHIEQRIALADAPVSKTGERNEIFAESFRDVANAIRELRSVTINGTGTISQFSSLTKEFAKNNDILNYVRFFPGENASTMIPVLSPPPARPGAFPEGTFNVPSDTQAALGITELKPNIYVSELPITAETLKLSIVDIERELPAIFAESFSDVLAEQVVQGNGTGLNFDGIFNNLQNTIGCQVTGVPRVMDLHRLAMEVKKVKARGAAIVMNHLIYSGILSDSTAEAAISQILKEEMVRTNTIEGIPIILTPDAPSSVVSGSTVCVAARLRDYAVAMAGTITIEPIRAPGDTRTHFQATAFFNGGKILNRNFIGLRTV